MTSFTSSVTVVATCPLRLAGGVGSRSMRATYCCTTPGEGGGGSVTPSATRPFRATRTYLGVGRGWGVVEA